MPNRLLTDKEIQQACRDGFVWFPVVSTADRNTAKAQDAKTHKVDCKEFGEWLEKHKVNTLYAPLVKAGRVFVIYPPEIEIFKQGKMPE